MFSRFLVAQNAKKFSEFLLLFCKSATSRYFQTGDIHYIYVQPSPATPLPKDWVDSTGISEETLRNAPTFEDAISQVRLFPILLWNHSSQKTHGWRFMSTLMSERCMKFISSGLICNCPEQGLQLASDGVASKKMWVISWPWVEQGPFLTKWGILPKFSMRLLLAETKFSSRIRICQMFSFKFALIYSYLYVKLYGRAMKQITFSDFFKECLTPVVKRASDICFIAVRNVTLQMVRQRLVGSRLQRIHCMQSITIRICSCKTSYLLTVNKILHTSECLCCHHNSELCFFHQLVCFLAVYTSVFGKLCIYESRKKVQSK